MLNLKNKVVFKGDRTLWYVVIGLMLASLIVVYSSTGSLAFRVRGGNTSYYLLKKTDVPLAIVECGFLSNPEEAGLLATKEYQEKVAEAVCTGILKYLEKSD